jgi:capsular polysaccharide export protein
MNAEPPRTKLTAASRPLVKRSKKVRINEIYAGALSCFDASVPVNAVGVWPFGNQANQAELKAAARSGNRAPQSLIGFKAKMTFLGWQDIWSRRALRRKKCDVLVVWNGIKGRLRMMSEAAKDMGLAVVYFEEAPLPKRITMDFDGVNYGSSLPRQIAFYQAWSRRTEITIDDWRKLNADLVARASTRGDVGQSKELEPGLDENFIFCPLQVPGDSQITIYGDWIKSVEDMIDQIAQASQALPEGWHIRVKEHPSARQAFGDKLRALEGPKFRLDNATDTFEQVAKSKAVLTVNSSFGLQAFFFDKPVLTLGKAFYAFDNIATKVSSLAELERICEDPAVLQFDQTARDHFRSYLDAAYYPFEEDVKAGKYTLLDAVARDKERDDILSSLPKS